MRTVPLDTLLKRILENLDEMIIPSLPTPFLRTQAIAVFSLLNNVAPRLEDRCDLVGVENRETRALLCQLQEALRRDQTLTALPQAHSLHISIVGWLGAGPWASLAEENKHLKQALSETIKATYDMEKEAPSQTLADVHRLIRTFLRAQLDRDLALYRPTRSGRMLRGT